MKKFDFLSSIFQQDNNLWNIFASLSVVILLRIILENFSNPFFTGSIGNFVTMISFFSFYMAVFLSITYVLYFFTKKPIKNIFNITVLISLSILIAPVWDLVFTGGHRLSYTTETGFNLIKIFFTMGSHDVSSGISWGMRVAVLITLIISFFFIKQNTYSNNKLRIAFMGTLFVYAVILIQGAWLSIIGTLGEFLGIVIKNQGVFWVSRTVIKNSFFATHHGLGTFFDWSIMKDTESFSLFMMRLHLISVTIAGWYIIKSGFSNIYTWFTKILPWKRIVMFIFFSLIGMVMADKLVFIKIVTNPVNISGFIMLCLGFVFHGITAIIVNDISDYDLDTVAHPERPIPSGLISLSEYKNLGIVTFVLGVLATISVNYTVTIFLIGIQSLYYIYTTYPLRLKRHWFHGLWIYVGIGLCILAVGYFFAASSQTLLKAPWKVFFIIAGVFSITAFQKDIPDAFADRQFGISSVPVVVGERNAVFISIVITPLLFGFLSYFFKSWTLCVVTIVFTSILLIKLIKIERNPTEQYKYLVNYVNTYIVCMSVFFLVLIMLILL